MTTLGQISGDVFGNYLYSGTVGTPNFRQHLIGAYAWFAITHELGHSLGLAHGGDYNASDDNDGDGQPDPITYDGDAYFFQDTASIHDHELFRRLGNRSGRCLLGWRE